MIQPIKIIGYILSAGCTTLLMGILLGIADPSITLAEPPPSSSLDRARLLIEEGRLPEARDLLHPLAISQPSDFEVRLELARLLVKMEDMDAAISEYEQLSAEVPDNRDVAVELAWTLMRASYFDRAVAQYEQLLEKEPNAVDLHLRRALALYGAGDLSDALNEYKTVLKLDPLNLEAQIGIYELKDLVLNPFHVFVGILFVSLAVIVLISLVVLAFVWARPSRPGASETTIGRLKERYIHFVAILSLAVATYYIIWRLTNTMNWDAWWFAVPVFGAELYGVIVAYMFFFMVWRPRHRTPPPPLPGRSVDVFITTFNEDPKLLRKTLLGCLRMTYPHQTYVLDDGNRPEVARLARELGVQYITREKNINAKAGNLNNALRLTRGEFILTLDADHVPLPHFLDRVLGYFAEEKVAFVQTPQDFYNIDSYQHRVDTKRRRMWTEQSLFFSVIQPGKDYWNSSFYCGSCGILRRKALEAIGGFAEATVTEDIHTSILLHAKKYRSVYHNESLAYGLAPGTTLPFLVQRLRWGQGAMQVLARDNPLWLKGLSLPQRISYFTSMTTYLDGFQKMIFYLAPVVYFSTGILPILAFNVVFLIHFIPYFVLFILSFELMARGHGSTFQTEQYNMAKFVTFMRTVGGLFRKKKILFETTPKAKMQQTGLSLLAPQILVFAINLFGIALGSYRYFWRGELVTLAYYGNVFWAMFNISLASTIVLFSRSKVQIRGAYRFLCLLPCSFYDAKTGAHSAQIGLIRDCHENGASLVTSKPIPEDTLIHLSMKIAEREVPVEGVVICSGPNQREGVGLFRNGIKFTRIAPEDQHYLIRYSFEFLVPRLMRVYRRATTVFDRLDTYIRQEQRRKQRWGLVLPITLQFLSGGASKEIQAVTDDIGEGGLSVMCAEQLPESGRVMFQISLADRPIRAAGNTLRRENLSSGGFPMYRYVLQYESHGAGDVEPLKEISTLLRLVQTQ